MQKSSSGRLINGMLMLAFYGIAIWLVSWYIKNFQKNTAANRIRRLVDEKNKLYLPMGIKFCAYG